MVLSDIAQEIKDYIRRPYLKIHFRFLLNVTKLGHTVWMCVGISGCFSHPFYCSFHGRSHVIRMLLSIKKEIKIKPTIFHSFSTTMYACAAVAAAGSADVY